MALVRDLKVEIAAELAWMMDMSQRASEHPTRKEPHTQRPSGPVFLGVGTIQFCGPHGI